MHDSSQVQKLFNGSNVLVTDSPLQQSDHVRTNNMVSTSRWFVGSSKVTSCDSVQMICGGHVRQHLVGNDNLQEEMVWFPLLLLWWWRLNGFESASHPRRLVVRCLVRGIGKRTPTHRATTQRGRGGDPHGLPPSPPLHRCGGRMKGSCAPCGACEGRWEGRGEGPQAQLYVLVCPRRALDTKIQKLCWKSPPTRHFTLYVWYLSDRRCVKRYMSSATTEPRSE